MQRQMGLVVANIYLAGELEALGALVQGVERLA